MHVNEIIFELSKNISNQKLENFQFPQIEIIKINKNGNFYLSSYI